jgi:5-methylcytosine-specific restriction endonuclease McrA
MSSALVRVCLCGMTFFTTRKNVVWHSNKCRDKHSRLRYSKVRDEKRRALLLAAEGSHTGQEWQEKFKRAGYMCHYCGKELYDRNVTKDHIIPLSRGGSNYISNIVPACQPCNSSKGSRTAFEFLKYLKHKKNQKQKKGNLAPLDVASETHSDESIFDPMWSCKTPAISVETMSTQCESRLAQDSTPTISDRLTGEFRKSTGVINR